MTDLGLVGIVDKGVYDSTATYAKGNFVYYMGSTFLCLLDNTSGITPAEGANWRFLAKGFNEAGASGITVIDNSGIVVPEGTATDMQTLTDEEVLRILANAAAHAQDAADILALQGRMTAEEAVGAQNAQDILSHGTRLSTAEAAINSAASLLAAICGNSAWAHNAFYRGKNLTNVYTIAQLSAKVSSGDFSDLYVGDYITVTATISGTNYTKNYHICGFDLFLGKGDTNCTTHHIVLMPDSPYYNKGMNEANDTTGAYVGSRMFTTDIPAINAGLQTAFGAAHILSHRELLTNAMTAATPSMAGMGHSGASTGWAWTDVKANLCSEANVYGGAIFSSSAMDNGYGYNQFPIFRLNPRFANCRSYWWLSSVVSATYFAYVSASGNAYGAHASNSNIGVRPYFLFT